MTKDAREMRDVSRAMAYERLLRRAEGIAA
jgi:hypothetical protein